MIIQSLWESEEREGNKGDSEKLCGGGGIFNDFSKAYDIIWGLDIKYITILETLVFAN